LNFAASPRFFGGFGRQFRRSPGGEGKDKGEEMMSKISEKHVGFWEAIANQEHRRRRAVAKKRYDHECQHRKGIGTPEKFQISSHTTPLVGNRRLLSHNSW
jgi:hypothetical protein